MDEPPGECVQMLAIRHYNVVDLLPFSGNLDPFKDRPQISLLILNELCIILEMKFGEYLLKRNGECL